MAEIVSLVRVQAKADGFDSVTAAIERLRGGYMSFGAALEQGGGKVVNLTKTFQGFERSLDPMGAKLAAWAEKSSNAINYAFDKGLISAERAAQRMEIIQKRLSDLGSLADREAARVAQAAAQADRVNSNRRIETRELTVADRAQKAARAQEEADRKAAAAEAVRAGSRAARQRQNDAFVEGILKQQEAKRRQAEQEEDSRQEQQFFREERRDQRLAQLQRARPVEDGLAQYTRRFQRLGMRPEDFDAGRRAEIQARDEGIVENAMREHERQLAARKAADDARQERQFYRPYEVKSLIQQRRQEAQDAAEQRTGGMTEYLQRADPVGQAEARYAAAVERVNQALADRVKYGERFGVSEAQASRILDHEATTLANIKRDFGQGKSGQSANRRTNLGYQGYDILTGLISGQPLGMIAAQQGPQIAQILGDAPGGMAGGIKEAGSALMGLLTPAKLAFGAIVGGAAAALYAVHRFTSERRDLNNSLMGLGMGTRATGSQLNAIAERAAQGQTFSPSTARGIVGTLAGTGRIDTSLMPEITRRARDYAAVTGQELPEATKELAQAFADPAKGAELLSGKLGTLTAKQVEFIQTQQRSGNELAAQRTLMEALNPILDAHGQKLSWLAREWEEFTSTLSRGVDRIGKVLSGPTIDEQLDTVRRKLDEMRNRGGLTQRQRQNLALSGRDPNALQAGLERQEADLDAQVMARNLQRELEAREATNRRDSSKATGIAFRVMPQIQQFQATDADIEFLEKQKVGSGWKPEILEKLGVSAQQLTETLARLRGAQANRVTDTQLAANADNIAMMRIKARTVAEQELIAKLERRQELANKEVSDPERRRQEDEAARRVREQANIEVASAQRSDAIATQSIQARTVAERAFVAFKEKENELWNQSLDPIEKTRRAQEAALRVQQQATMAARDTLRQTAYDARSTGMLPYAKGLTDLASQREEALRLNPENAKLINMNADLRRQMFQKEQIEGPQRQSALQLNEQIAAIKVQRDSFLQNATAAGEIAAKQDLINQYLRAGIQPEDDLLKAIEARAKLYGQAAGEADKLNRVQQNITSGMDELRSGGRGALTGIFSDLRQGKNVLDGLANSFGRMADQMFDRLISKPLMENLLGFDGKGGGGAIGNWISQIFGKTDGIGKNLVGAQVTSMMTVNAATVVINAGAAMNAAGAGIGIGSAASAGGLGTNPSTGQSLAGTTGSGALGFGLGGPQASGARGSTAFTLPGSGLTSFGLGANGTSMGTGSLAGVNLAGITKLGTDQQREVAAYIAQGAQARGIDPNTALRVFQQESSFNRAATNINAREESYGVTQLNAKGGLGVDALNAGINIRDPSTWRQQIDFSLDKARQGGWAPWYGARDVGISRWQGIGGPNGSSAQPRSLFNQQTSEAEGNADSLKQATDQASQSMTKMTDAASQIPQGTDSATSGLSSLFNKLASFGGGGGGFFGLGGGSGAEETVTAAAGGLIRGPGTSTSDSIPARLSNGEFVVNAAATRQHHDLLHHINSGRTLLGFAGGGPVGLLPVYVPPAFVPANSNVPSERPISFVVNNNHSTAKVSGTESRDANGNRRFDVRVDEMVSDAMARSGSRSNVAARRVAGGALPQY